MAFRLCSQVPSQKTTIKITNFYCALKIVIGKSGHQSLHSHNHHIKPILPYRIQHIYGNFKQTEYHTLIFISNKFFVNQQF